MRSVKNKTLSFIAVLIFLASAFDSIACAQLEE